MNFQPSRKQAKRFNTSLLAKPQARTETSKTIQPSQKQAKRVNIYLVAKPQARTETNKTIRPLSSGKVRGSNEIPAEIFKAGCIGMAEKLTELYHCMSKESNKNSKMHPQPIYKKRKEYSSLGQLQMRLSFIKCWKDTSNTPLNCLNIHPVQAGLIPERQSGFRTDREQ